MQGYKIKFIFGILPAVVFLLLSVLSIKYFFPIDPSKKTLIFSLSLFLMSTLFLLLATYKITLRDSYMTVNFCMLTKNVNYNEIYELVIGNKSYVTGMSYINIRYYKDELKKCTGLLIISSQINNFEDLISSIKIFATNAKIKHE